MDADAIRNESRDTARKAGLVIPDHLPLLEGDLKLRGQDEAIERLLCLTATGAASYGFESSRALAWLHQENLEGMLTKDEFGFIQYGAGKPQVFQVQIEAAWALAWALQFVPALDFWRGCDMRFATLLPNLKISQSSNEWRRKAHFRSTEEVVAAFDLAYCLHWIVRQADITGKSTPGCLKSYVVVERRRALEWLLCDEEWDAITLDT